MSFQQNAFQHNALQTGVAAGSAPVQLDGGDEFGWLGLQSVIGGVVLAAAALVSGNAQSQTFQHQDEVPYVTGNPIGYGQPYTQRAQVKPVFIQMGTGDELPISAAPNFVDDTTPPVFSPKIEIPLPAPVWDDPQLCRILVEENEWGNPFVVPQIVVAPTFGHHDELGTTPAAPILEESEYLWPSILPTPFTGLWNSQDERPTPVITFPPSEEDWSFQNLSKDSIDGIIWVTDDDIAPAFAAEEIGWKAEWLIPKPFTEVLWTTDEIPTAAAQPQGGGGVVYDEISIFRWYQEDPLPVTATPLGIDEEPWKPPVLSLEGPKWLDSPDELIVPQPAPTIREDDYWLGCPTFLPEAIRAVWDSQDEILPSIRDEEPWIGPSYPAGPFTGTFSANDDIVPQPPTEINVEETYNLDWLPVQPWADDRSATLQLSFSAGNEVFPELSTPPEPPVVDTQKPAGKSKRHKKRYQVEIDGQVFEVRTQDEVYELLDKAKELAKDQAKTVVERAQKAVKRPARKVLADARKSLVPPEINVSGLTLDIEKILRDIEDIYNDAFRTVEITTLLRKKDGDDDDEEAILMLL